MRIYTSIIISSILLLAGCSSSKFAYQYNKNITEVSKLDDDLLPDLNFDPQPTDKICLGVAIYSKDLPVDLLPVLLSKVYGVEINLSQKSDLKISFNHSNVCLEQLLSELTDLYNIGFQKTHSGYSMYINSLRTQFFNLNYHNLLREGSSQLTVQSRSFDASPLSSGSASSDKNSYIETKTADNFWTNVTKNIQNLINFNDPKDAGSSFSVYQESGVIVVNSYPRTLKNIKKFIDKINENCLKQVSIEARILEISLRDEFSSGINWNVLDGAFKVSQSGKSSDGVGLVTIKAGNKSSFNPIITALANQGHISVLSSPRISILNNQRGVIKFGEDGYYLTNVSSSSSSSTSDSATSGQDIIKSNINLTPIFSGLALDATASILNEREVILHIHPTITSVDEMDKTITVDDKKSTLPLAVIKSREADTVVRAVSGEIVIIGGLMQSDVEMNRANLRTNNSFLNKILKAFGSKGDHLTKTELVILLRPVIDGNNIWSDDLGRYLIKESD